MAALDSIRYVCLPRELVETISNLPPVSKNKLYRKADLYLKNGTRVSDVHILNSEFAVLSREEHINFEAKDISFAEFE